jgi:mannose-6-phosphate isomerase-like protein (cupin superfamily)
MEKSQSSLEIHTYTGSGYKPLVFFDGWQVAHLNWEPIYELENAGEIERHNQTDEVFVLWRGRAALFVSTPEGFCLEDMQPGVIYNVPRGVWHALLSTKDAAWIIVENRDTHLHDTEIRRMSDAELRQLHTGAPDWVR